MPIDAVGGGQQAQQTGAAAQRLGGLDSEAFLKLLVAQLRYQNPMAPSDGTAMLQQTAQFTQVETLQALAQSQKDLLGYQQSAMAAGLVGKQVTLVGEDGAEVTGTVDAMRFTETGPVLRVGERELPLDAAIEIRMPDTGDATSRSI